MMVHNLRQESRQECQTKVDKVGHFKLISI